MLIRLQILFRRGIHYIFATDIERDFHIPRIIQKLDIPFHKEVQKTLFYIKKRPALRCFEDIA